MTDSLMKKLEIDRLDLREVSRECHYLTVICLKNPYGGEEEWIICGQLEVNDLRIPGRVDIGSRMRKGVTDQEHDSAWAFKLPLIGWRYNHTYWGLIEFNGYIAPPQGDYDLSSGVRLPTSAPDLMMGEVTCTDCDEEHPIVDYLPAANEELYRRLSGRLVSVKMGVDPEHYDNCRKEQ